MFNRDIDIKTCYMATQAANEPISKLESGPQLVFNSNEDFNWTDNIKKRWVPMERSSLVSSQSEVHPVMTMFTMQNGRARRVNFETTIWSSYNQFIELQQLTTGLDGVIASAPTSSMVVFVVVFIDIPDAPAGLVSSSPNLINDMK